jgi:hypothetical protein
MAAEVAHLWLSFAGAFVIIVALPRFAGQALD